MRQHCLALGVNRFSDNYVPFDDESDAFSKIPYFTDLVSGDRGSSSNGPETYAKASRAALFRFPQTTMSPISEYPELAVSSFQALSVWIVNLD